MHQSHARKREINTVVFKKDRAKILGRYIEYLIKSYQEKFSTNNDGWMRPAYSTWPHSVLGSEQLLIDFLPVASKKDFQSRLLMDFVTLVFIYVLRTGLIV